MKIQCSCGTKYAFDVSPEMAQKPIRFVCQKCGLDSSDMVNELIRRELAAQTPAPATPPPAPVRVVMPGFTPPIESTPPPAPIAPVVEAPRLKVAHETPSPEPAAAPAPAPSSKYCPKHRRNLATYRCLVCQKPMCSECMKLFGYVCSPLCKAKAEAEKINVPVYAGQSAVAEARFWRKTGAAFGALALAVVLALGFWFWYAWFGSVPHTVFSVKFDERAFSGASKLVGPDQFIFLHGGTLTRYDLKTKKQIWSQELITDQQVADVIKRQNEIRAATTGNLSSAPPDEKRKDLARQELEADLQLHVSGQNVWVISRALLTHYDWNTGNAVQEIPIMNGSGRFVARDNQLLLVQENDSGQQFDTRINLTSGEVSTEQIYQPEPAANSSAPPGATGVASGQAASGLPLSPGVDAGKPMDPAKVAQQAQGLPLAARIALPAILGNSEHQEQIQAEINGQDQAARPKISDAQARQARIARGPNYFTLVPSENGYVQFSVTLLESHIVARSAMKAPPAKSALNGDLNVSQTADVANETLNEMQRNRGGYVVEEDESRYQVSLRRPDSTEAADDWTGEVVGPPAVFSLKTVNVLAAGKTVIVFDKSNRKLWQADFTYNISSGNSTAAFGAGPVVEHAGTLYVFDQAVLTAFDLANGNARWRLPSVGVVGLFFDDQGMVYVNTTTADPDTIRYSRQIDVTQKIEAILYKLDPQTGRTLWSVKPGGFISYLSGKFIYTVEIFNPDEEDTRLASVADITPTPPHLRIQRLDPKNGRTLWEHYQERTPLDVQFDANSIELVFKKEVQVLKYLTF